ncbi:ABC transporter substrate-binding protein [Bacillus sp. SD088]|uniref:ABC transporter substrate-binding protein n=1 Tax=Bacillus sp. SD088 TaxID=2782012 RepID=UPI001A9603FE|nr:sugar ABC transporter substrate-binding protein [Bacillus sp. SD088]MBO0993235.1 sugar ABC transporter substrate-binding protein [Bacillus sp. SD088]
MKKWFATLVCLISVILMVACSSDNAKDKDGNVTIQMAISGSKAEKKIREDTAKAFMEENPNIKIKWVDLGDRRYEKTLTLISGGNAPDILYLNEWVPALAKRNALMPLDELIENDSEFDLDEFYEGLINGNKFEDKLYALPQEVSPYVIYYNKDLFDKAGLDYPNDDWTQQEFLDIALALTNSEDNQYGFLYENGYNPTLGWIFRNNGKFFNDDGTKSGLDSPEVLKTFKFLKEFVEKGISPNPAELEATGQGADAQFRNQQVAMVSAGMWFLPPFKDEPLDFNWDVVKMPKAENQDVGAGILSWAISSQTKHKEEAWKVLKYFTGHEGMMEVADSQMALPSTKDEEANQLILDSKFPENVQAFVDSADHVVMDGYISPFTSELMEMIEQETEKMLLGNQSPEETQENIVEQMNGIISQ